MKDDPCSYKKKKKSGRYIDRCTVEDCPLESWVPEIGDRFDSAVINSDRATASNVKYRFKIMTPSFVDKGVITRTAMLPVPPESPETANISSIPITCLAHISNDSTNDFILPHVDGEEPLDFWFYTTALDRQNPVFYRGVIRSYKYPNLWTLAPGEKRWTYQVIHLPIFIPDERAFGEDERPRVGGTKRIYFRFWGLWSYDDFDTFSPADSANYDVLL